MKKNEYGAFLDRNGYAPTVINWPQGICAICNRRDRPLQRHEIFHGPYRDKAKKYGLWVYICDSCHMRLHHQENRLDRELKAMGQREAMAHYHWSLEKFRAMFGKNYLPED